MEPKFTLAFILLALLFCNCNHTEQTKGKHFKTYFEKSNYLETPRYDETIEFCKKLADNSSLIHYTKFGISPQGRDLPLLIADKDGDFDVNTIRSKGNLILLIQACIHPGESEGKDAGLMLFRDFVSDSKNKKLLDSVSILFIPIFNTDGHERFGKYNRINQNGPVEMGWRTTAHNYNLNRDYLKADAPEMQDWLIFFNHWLPDFFIDCHTTDGADYQYTITYDLNLYGNLASPLSNWINKNYLPEIEDKMKKDGYLIFPYVMFKNWHDPRSGLMSWIAEPKLSEGYSCIQNRPALLIETHMLKDYKTRVYSTYSMIYHTLSLLNKNCSNLKNNITKANNIYLNPDNTNATYPVLYKTAETFDTIEFKGVKYNVVKSDLTGGNWYQYKKGEDTVFQLRFYNKQIPDKTISIPRAYIIPAEWKEVIARIKLHGIKCYNLKTDTSMYVHSYRFKDIEFDHKPYEGRMRVKCNADSVYEIRKFSNNSVVIPTQQRAAQLIFHILEPDAPDSYVRWGFFNTIFEQKEYAESYVMEEKAREMLKDGELKNAFDSILIQNPELADNPWAMLNWFYSKTPYWDKNLNAYPIGKIYQEEKLNGILKDQLN